VKKIIDTLLHVSLLAALLLPAVGTAGDPLEFKVTMEMLRNGKTVGETVFSFTAGDEQWVMQSQTRGTRGLAKFIGLEEQSFSRGDWAGDVPRPAYFERNVKAVKKMRWEAQFDWAGGQVRSIYPDGESTLAIEAGVVDESTLGMLIRAGLGQGQDEWFPQVLDEDEIEQNHFRARPAERIQTALGCMTAYAVEKIRREGSTRYTRTYHARDHEFVPVLIEHGKTDGDHLESRVKTLEIDGKTIPRGPDCA
jgi:hypothetical protein